LTHAGALLPCRNTKDVGIEGNCSVIAYNAFVGPSKPIWSDLLEEDCDEARGGGGRWL